MKSKAAPTRLRNRRSSLTLSIITADVNNSPPTNQPTPLKARTDALIEMAILSVPCPSLD